MKKLLPFIILIMLAGCNSSQKTASSTPFPYSAPATTPDDTNDVNKHAQSLVGFDDGLKLPEKDDIRVKRARYLLEYLTTETKETPKAIAVATNFTSDFLEKQYGKKITRLQLLEDMKAIYASGNSKKIGNTYQDVIKISALITYGK